MMISRTGIRSLFPRALALGLSVGLLFAAAPAAQADAADPEASTANTSAAAPLDAMTSATLDWGVKQSFTHYITGPIAHGQIIVSGTTQQRGSGFTWNSGAGRVDDGFGAGDVRFADSGGVRFLGHDGALDTSLSDPRIVIISADTAQLFVDADGLRYPEATPYHAEGVHLADIALPQPTIAGGAVTWSAAPTTLVASGVEVFAGFYPAGTKLDPITLSTGNIGATPAPPVSTTVTMTASATSVRAGEALTLRATVAPATAAGTVQFWDSGAALGPPVALADGNTAQQVTFAEAGTHRVTARFTPADPAAWAPAASEVLPVAAQARPTVTTVSTVPARAVYNSAVEVRVRVSSPGSAAAPTGRVSVTVAGQRFDAALRDGVAAVKLTAPVAAGNAPVSASYVSNAPGAFAGSRAVGALVVTKATPTVSAQLASSSVTRKQAARLTVRLSVPGTLRATVPQSTVQVFDGSKRITTAAVQPGRSAAVTLPKLGAGTHQISVRYGGNANLAAKQSAVTKLRVR